MGGSAIPQIEHMYLPKYQVPPPREGVHTAPQLCFSRLFPAPIIPFACTFSRGYLVFGIWADIYDRFKVCLTHLSIYQNFLLKPIRLPNFFPQSQTRCQFLLSNPSIYRNSHFLEKIAHPSIYISFLKPIHLHRSYVFAKICMYLPSGTFLNLPFYRFG